ncbi:MAG: helix-turn-helix domain-containing protein [Bacteroidia bacterium]|nr:helix-turn-helix domain-containing protein [Bacteroidia bacterium]
MNHQKTYTLIGEKLKELRIKAGYTSYEDFAMEFNLSRRHYWEVEKGRNINIKTLVNLLTIHGMSLHQFFRDKRFK